jgi:hypothetical protein
LGAALRSGAREAPLVRARGVAAAVRPALALDRRAARRVVAERRP